MNVIILTAATGGGHNRAAGALKEYINTHDPSANVDILDAIEECSALLNSIVVKGYKALVTYTPALFGAIYKGSDKPSALNDMINLAFSQCAKRLLPFISAKKPDVVISCHPFTAGILAYMKQKEGYDVPLISIVTDFIPHRAYVIDGVDAFITASQKGKDILTSFYGIPEDKVYFYGHPIYEKFYEGNGRPREEVLTELGLSPDKLTVLVMAGSFGVEDILKIYEKLVCIDIDYQMIVITGRNKRLYEAFEKILNDEREFETYGAPEFIKELPADNVLWSVYNSGGIESESRTETYRRTSEGSKPTKLFFFVDNVEDYMHASDLIITKPGGLTTSESIACSLPMAVFKAYPGQEEQNAELLREKGIGIILDKGDAVAEQVSALLNDPERLKAMKEACKSYARKDSCAHIYALAKKLAEKE